MLFFQPVPSDPPSHMEALLLNSSAVYLKWKPPALQAHNGKLRINFSAKFHENFIKTGQGLLTLVVIVTVFVDSVEFDFLGFNFK